MNFPGDKLEPPLIQIGAYWSARTDAESFRRCLTWLHEHGYRVDGPVAMVRAEKGQLPRFLDLCSGRDEVIVEQWKEAASLRFHQILPVRVGLVKGGLSDRLVVLQYAVMNSASIGAGDQYVVEMIVSGSALNLRDAMGDSNVSRSVNQLAGQTETWCEQIFRTMCDELEPEYAGTRWEYSLQPPASLVASNDLLDYFDLYVNNEIASLAELDSVVGTSRIIAVRSFKAGIHITPVGAIDPTVAEFEEVRRRLQRAIATVLCSEE